MGPALVHAPLRSLLFCPADAGRKVAKALASAADAVILDLEDAVAPGAKDAARAGAVEALRGPRAAPVIVRVNEAGTDAHLADLAAVVAAGPDAVMLPKCGGPEDLARLSARLDALEVAFGLPVGGVGILPLVSEDAGALRRLDYAGVPSRLVALGFAGEDLAADLGIAARRPGALNPLLARAREAVAIAAAAAGVPAIDTPFPDPADAAGLESEARAAAELGYAGKFCIHPAQIAPVTAAFRPPVEALDWARSVVATLSGGSGVATVNGRMVDGAHLKLARRYLRQSAIAEA